MDEVAESHGFGTTDHTRSNMPTRYQFGATGSHGFGTPDRTCQRGIRTGLQDLTGSKHQIERAYEVSDGVAGSHGLGKQDRTCVQDIRMWLQDLWVRNNRSYMPTRYQDGAAGSHGYGTTDPTCQRGIRTGLQNLTGSEHQIVHTYRVSGRGCRISRARNMISCMP